jgi:hypothetical protein
MDEIRIANNKQNTSNRAKRARANGWYLILIP